MKTHALSSDQTACWLPGPLDVSDPAVRNCSTLGAIGVCYGMPSCTMVSLTLEALMQVEIEYCGM